MRKRGARVWGRWSLLHAKRFERVMFVIARWCNLIQRWLMQATYVLCGGTHTWATMVAFVFSSTEVQSRDEDKLCMCS